VQVRCLALRTSCYCIAKAGAAGAPATQWRSPEPVDAMSVSPDSRWLVTRSKEGTVPRLWSLGAREPGVRPFALGGHAGAVKAVALQHRRPLAGDRESL
jgi:hypothetical protein